MKKTLMVLGLAMCASFAYAQTESFRVPRHEVKTMDFKNDVAKPAPDYKASIFTKARIDTVRCFRFDAASMADIIYGTDGEVQPNSIVYIYDATINGWKQDTLKAHAQNGAYSHWERVADSAAFFTGNYPGTYNSDLNAASVYMGSRYTGDDNGFMFMTMGAATGSGQHNAYFQMPAVPKNDTAALIEIRMTQYHRKYYDQCWIDYKIGANWYAREINVENIDVQVNRQSAVYARYAMPVELASEANYTIRIRWASREIGNTYGYVWAVDNVAITVGAANHWYSNGDHYIDGGYGQIPQGFHIPLSWYGAMFNDGGLPQLNSKATIYALDANKNATPVLEVTKDTLFANSIMEQYIIANERGFMPEASDIANAGWFGHGTHAARNYNNTSIWGGFDKRALPTTTPGLNYVTATVTNPTSGLRAAVYDTIAYNVTTEIGGEQNQSELEIKGYRWSHDNGIIPAGSRYSTGYTDNQGTASDPKFYVTDSGHYGDVNYMVRLRYNTPDVIPTDAHGDPWVFLGMEIVPKTEGSARDMVGSKFFPTVNRIDYKLNTTPDSSGYYTQSTVNTGVSDELAHELVAGEINDLVSGRLANTDDYRAVNIRFFNMPEIEPNTSYYFGYRIAEPCTFAAARHLYGYSNGGSATRYNADPEIANWYTQFTPEKYDLWVYDPVNGSSGLFAGVHDNNFPMIRVIVGPRESLQEHGITANCADSSVAFVIAVEDQREVNICGRTHQAVQGSDPSVYVVPAGNNTPGSHPGIIDELIIDNTHVPVANLAAAPAGVQIAERPYNIYDADSNLLLRRYYYVITFASINDNHTVSYAGHNTEFGLGIEAEASNVALGLRPNPATSQVSLNIKGVTGTVNCSILDMSGRVVYSRNLNAEEAHTIDLSNVAAGAYFVRVTNDSFSKVEKLIVR